MKAKTFILAVFMIVSGCSILIGQSVTCSDFSVLEIHPDTLNPEKYHIDIQFNAASSNFINYPYIHAVLDCNGDSVAAGDIFIFGQVGQSTVAYPVTISGSLECEPLTVVFVYGDENLNNDTCLLTFGTSSLVTKAPLLADKFFIFPNPSANHFNIQSTMSQIGTSYLINDFTGKVMLTGTLISVSTRIDMNSFSSGIYFIKIGDNALDTFKVVKE